MERKRYPELFWSVLLLFLAVAGLAWLIPDFVQMPPKLKNPYLSPRLWPTIIFYCVGALGACMLLNTLFAIYKERSTNSTAINDNSGQSEGGTGRQAVSVLACLGCMGLCMILIYPLGMPLSITLCLAALLWLAGKRVPLVGTLCLLALPTLLYLFFFHVADVSIPLGIFE